MKRKEDRREKRKRREKRTIKLTKVALNGGICSMGRDKTAVFIEGETGGQERRKREKKGAKREENAKRRER